MIKQPVTLLEVYERHVKAGTCKFESWCDFVAWYAKAKTDAETLDKLKELSEQAFAESKKPSTPKTEPKQETKKQKSSEAKKGE